MIRKAGVGESPAPAVNVVVSRLRRGSLGKNPRIIGRDKPVTNLLV